MQRGWTRTSVVHVPHASGFGRRTWFECSLGLKSICSNFINVPPRLPSSQTSFFLLSFLSRRMFELEGKSLNLGCFHLHRRRCSFLCTQWQHNYKSQHLWSHKWSAILARRSVYKFDVETRSLPWPEMKNSLPWRRWNLVSCSQTLNFKPERLGRNWWLVVWHYRLR